MVKRRAVVLKSHREIRVMHEVNIQVAEILKILCAAVEPGISTLDLDFIARAELKGRGLESPFLGYYDYPATVCISINEEVVHGIPRREKILNDGDLISIDFGVRDQGYVGDAARTIPVGTITAAKQQLIDVTKKCLDAAIEICVPGTRISEIGKMVQGIAESNGYGVVREFVGHGIGTRMHEDPQVPNFYDRPLPRMKSGLVIAIEPMINMGGPAVRVLDDKWTAVTQDHSCSAHFEDSIAITDDGPIILSRIAA